MRKMACTVPSDITFLGVSALQTISDILNSIYCDGYQFWGCNKHTEQLLDKLMQIMRCLEVILKEVRSV